MREIASRFPEFNVTTFHEYYPFADQYLELKPSLVQNIVLGIISMAVVTLIMIPDWRAAMSVVVCIASINLGTFLQISLLNRSIFYGFPSCVHVQLSSLPLPSTFLNMFCFLPASYCSLSEAQTVIIRSTRQEVNECIKRPTLIFPA